MNDWNLPIYAFFHPTPTIGYKEGHRYHEFHCFVSTCNKSVHQFLDKKDAGSTSNLHKHTKICRGLDMVKAAMGAQNASEARQILSESKDGSIAAAFQIKGKGKVTYSHRQHTQTETKWVWSPSIDACSWESHRAEIICWVSENAQPFSIVNDCGFKKLIKTGWPEYYLPSPTTVLRDVHLVFAHLRQHIASLLCVSDCSKINRKKLKQHTETWREAPFHNRHLEIFQSPSLCCIDGSFQTWGKTCVPNSRCHRGGQGQSYAGCILIMILTLSTSPIVVSTLPLHSQMSWRNLVCWIKWAFIHILEWC